MENDLEKPAFLSLHSVIPLMVSLYLSLVGASSGEPISNGNNSAQTLRVGIYQNPPKIFMDGEGRPAGILVDILTGISEKEHWTLNFTPCDWPDCLLALEDRQIDLMPDVAYSTDRDLRFDFHRIPALESWSQMYSNPSVDLERLSDLNGLRIGVLKEAVQNTLFKQMMDGFGYKVTLTPTESFNEAFRLAGKGDVDVVFSNNYFGDYSFRQYGLVKTPIVFAPTSLFYAVAKGRNADLLKTLDRYLKTWKANPDSPYYRTLKRWMGQEPISRVPGYFLGLLAVAVVFLIVAVFFMRHLARRRKQAESDRKASEILYRTIVETANEGIWICDISERTLFANPAIARMLGYEPQEMIGNPITDFIDKSARSEFQARFANRHRGVSETYKLLFRTKDGKPLLGLVSAAPLRDPNGAFSGSIALIANITEVDRLEQELRRAGDQALLILDNSPDAIFIVADRTIQYANPSTLRLLGAPSTTALTGRPILDLVHPDDRDLIRERFQKYATGASHLPSIDLRFVGLDGITRVTESLSLKQSQDGSDAIIVFARDVTDRRRAEQALRISEERFRALFESMAEGVALHRLMTDEAGNPVNYEILAVNPAYARHTGIPLERARGLATDVYGTPTPPYLEEFSQTVLTGQPGTLEVFFPPLNRHFSISITRYAPGHFATIFEDVTLRKNAAESLQRSQKEWEDTFNGMTDWVILLDPEGRILRSNRRSQEVLGLDPNTLPGRFCHEVVHGTRHWMTDCPFAKMLKSGQAETHEFQLAGNGPWIQVSVDPIRDPEGRLKQVVHIVRDITARKNAELQLKQTMVFNEKLIQTANAILVVLDPQGRVVLMNEAAERITGYTFHEVMGRSWFETLVPKDRYPQVWEEFQRLTRGGTPGRFENPILTRSGKERHILWSNSDLRESGDRIGTISFGVDITDQKRAEQALRDSETRFELFMSNSPDIAFIKDSDYRIVFLNLAFERFFGITLAQAIGKTDFDIFPRNVAEHTRADDERVLTTGKSRTLEESFPGPDGRVHHWQTQKFVFTDSLGRRFLAGTAVNITGQKEAEASLLNAVEVLKRNNRELQEFAFVASHDLQEPLRKIRSFGDFLQEELGPSLGDRSADYLNRMIGAATRMQALIDGLLTYSRITTQASPFEKVDVGRIAREVAADLETLTQRTGGRIEIGDLPSLESDPIQMRQLLQNLIGNSLKFHRKGVPPIVRISATIDPESKSYCLTVGDNGIGFDEKYLDRIFNLFQRLHGRDDYEGTGMGLSICRRIAERHGGTISARSTPGVGSEFIVILPSTQVVAKEVP